MGVIRSVRRVHGDQHERSRHGFSDLDSVVVDVGGQLGSGLRFTRLRKNKSVFGSVFTSKFTISVVVEFAGGIQRIHVIHVVHAAHLLFDGRGDRLFQRLRVRADVGGQHLNFRRSDVGELRHRQTKDRDACRQSP